MIASLALCKVQFHIGKKVKIDFMKAVLKGDSWNIAPSYFLADLEDFFPLFGFLDSSKTA